MEVLGKCKPKKNILEELYSMGYDYVELYLTTELLEDTEQLIKTCKNASISVESVHSPHTNMGVTTTTTEQFQKADKLATELDATYLLHSNPFSTFSLIEFYSPTDITSDSFCYENHPDVSRYMLENYLLGQGYPIALDIAHLYIAEENYLKIFEEFLHEYSSAEIPILHLADGTRIDDGLYFGEGEIDIETVFEIVAESYNGKVVLEIPTSDRSKALQYSSQFL